VAAILYVIRIVAVQPFDEDEKENIRFVMRRIAVARCSVITQIDAKQ